MAIHRRGFTLVELLTALAIISVLIALLAPAVGKARLRARRVQCESNLRQLGVGFKSYLHDNLDVFPYASYMPSVSSIPLPPGDPPIYIADVLAPHLNGSERVFECPQDSAEDRFPPNEGRTYFETEKCSYLYRTGRHILGTHPSRLGFPGLCGLTMSEVVQIVRSKRGLTYNENNIWIMHDYGDFHGRPGTKGSKRYLYYDCHVEDYQH